MPTVPHLDTFQVSPNAAPNVAARLPDMPDPTAQARQMGEASSRAQESVTAIYADALKQVNQGRVDDALNQLVKTRTDMQVEALSLKGRNALDRPDGKSLPDEYDDKLDQASQSISGALGNDAQRATFLSRAAELRNQMRGTLSNHMMDQHKVFRADTQKATIETAVNQGVLLYGDEGMRQQSLQTIGATVAQMAKDNGWDDKVKAAALSEAISPLHAGIIKSMIQGGNASQARDYYEQNSASMTLQSRANLQGILKEAGDSQIAEAEADIIWGYAGPKSENDAVRIYDMEQMMRENLKDNPDALKKGIDALRQRAHAINAQQTEVKAQNISGVWKLIDSGTSMRQVQVSDAWLALTDTERHNIKKTIEAEQATRSSRAASDSSRALSDMQRQEKLAYLRNGDDYLTATNPDELAKMSRAQVEAKRGLFGMEATQHLLAKWDALQKPGKIVEARIDRQDFEQIADKLGLQPFKKDASEEHKRGLGTLHYRVEQLIDRRQRELKRPLDRQEKMVLMEKELATTVTVNPGWFSSNQQVPVVRMTDAQAKGVVVPAEDRQKIIEALNTKYQKDPNNPAYFPNETNVKRLYLMNKSKAGGMINYGK